MCEKGKKVREIEGIGFGGSKRERRGRGEGGRERGGEKDNETLQYKRRHHT